MILTVDIGNSNIVCVLYDHEQKRVYDIRLDTLKKEHKGDYPKIVNQILKPLKIAYEIEDFIMSCVVPSITEDAMKAFQEELGVQGHLLSMEMVPELVVHLDQANELGADLIATTYGALKHFDQPCIVVDMGSATKITAINAKGEFNSGLLLPGLKVAQNAMNAFIPHLPEIPLEFPQQLLGRDTVACMQAGLMYSTIDSIIGISQRIEKEFNANCVKVLTGGLSNVVKDALADYEFEPFLLNDGLIELYTKKLSKPFTR